MNRKLFSGFSLVEMMISIVLGLILMSAVMATMLTTMQTSGETVRSTKLNQELRALLEIVTRDIKRARYLEDSMTFIGEAMDDDNGDGVVNSLDWRPANPYENVAVVPGGSITNDGDPLTVDGGCISYAYQGAENGAFRRISWQSIGGVGAVTLGRANAAGGVPGCNAAVDGVAKARLSSPEIDITALIFNYKPAAAAVGVNDDLVEVTIQGRLVGDPTIQRRMSQAFQIRTMRLPPLPPVPVAAP